MARKDDSNLLSRVSTVLERLDDRKALKLPASLAADIKQFRAGVAPFVKAAARAAAALTLRDEALAKVGDADAVLDGSVDDLADTCVGAKIAKRARPFAGLSPHNPTAIKNLAFAKEVAAVAALLGALAKKKPPASVQAAASKVQKNAAAVKTLLAALTGPQASYVTARTARDALTESVSKAHGRFKLRAKAALVDDPGTYEALFGARAAVQAPPRPKRKPKPVVVNGAGAAKGVAAGVLQAE